MSPFKILQKNSVNTNRAQTSNLFKTQRFLVTNYNVIQTGDLQSALWESVKESKFENSDKIKQNFKT